MTAQRERWLRLSRLFDEAVELDAAACEAFVRERCAGDAALEAELRRMLAADAAASGLDAGAAGIVSMDAPTGGDTAGADSARGEDAAAGERLGPWRLEALLGRGGMGSVYAARRDDGDAGQRAAIKRLRRRWDGSGQAQRFLQERRILAQLSHPNIPALIDHGLDDDGRPWFALEYVDGDGLVAWADARRLGLRERVALFAQVCAAVQHAHERFVVHRDLKPANILVDGSGRVRVLDFGVAKRLDREEGATRTGLFAGFTPEYAAPEQISGGGITAATDVYGLGVVLYQLLSGQLPYAFAHDDLRGAAEAITSRTAERLDRALTTGDAEAVRERVERRSTSPAAFRRFVRGDLTRIVQTALAKEPGRRYPSVQAFANDLQRFLDGRPVSVGGDTFGYRARKFVRRNRWGVAMAMLAALTLVAGLTGIAMQAREARREAARATASAHEARQQRDAALTEVGRGNAIREYVQLMFREASETRDTQTMTAREVLKEGTDRLFAQFRSAPAQARPVALMLAELYMEMGDWEGATPLLERVLASPGIQRDPDTQAKAEHYLAQAALTRGEADTARAMLDRAQATWAHQPARYAAALNESRITQAKLERGAGDADRAIATLRAMIAQRPRLVGGPDREQAVAYATLSAFLLDQGAYPQSEASALQATAIFDRLGMGKSAQAIVAVNNRAASLALRDRNAEAEPLFRRLVALHRELYGTSSMGLALMQTNLADAIRRQGRSAEAIPLLQDARRIAIASSGARSAATLHVSLTLAETYVDAGRAADAAPLVDQVFAIATRNLAAKDRTAGFAYRVRAELRAARGDRDGAQQDLRAAASIFAALGAGGRRPLAKLEELRVRLGL